MQEEEDAKKRVECEEKRKNPEWMLGETLLSANQSIRPHFSLHPVIGWQEQSCRERESVCDRRIRTKKKLSAALLTPLCFPLALFLSFSVASLPRSPFSVPLQLLLLRLRCFQVPVQRGVKCDGPAAHRLLLLLLFTPWHYGSCSFLSSTGGQLISRGLWVRVWRCEVVGGQGSKNSHSALS